MPNREPDLFQQLLRNIDNWKLPGIDDRTSIVGKTGSGKTFFGVYLMIISRLYRKMPWIIFDYKGDEFIGKVPARELSQSLIKPPVEPGIYRLRLNPFDHSTFVESFLKRVWENGNTGLFFDEAYMLPDRRGLTEQSALRAIYTTGRSRKIPVIALSQRPVDVLRYNFTEASHHVIFRLNDLRDMVTVRAYVPRRAFEQAFGKDGKDSLPKFHSYWYDVNRDLSFEMLPCPGEDQLTELFDEIRKVKQWS